MSKTFMKSLKKSKQAFTLLELLIVIAVIGILVAVILPNLMGMRERARDTVKKNDLSQLKKALRLYFDDHGVYPLENLSTDTICCSLPTDPCTACGFNFEAGGETYMRGLPVGYEYWRAADGYSFRLTIELENAADKDIELSQQRCSGGIYTSTTYVVCED